MKYSNIAIFVPHAGCPYRCSFCDQHTITGMQTIPRAADVTRICEEAFSRIRDPGQTEIAFFGGSFTAVPRGLMTELLDAAQPYAERCRGIRISTRPDCIDGEILSVLRRSRVTSIELGAQSLDDAVLAANDRGHTAADVIRASDMIRQAGFELGLQVMPGLYKADPASDRRTAEAVCGIRPDTVRIYPVVILQGTRLGELYCSGEYQPAPFPEMVQLVAEWMELYRVNGIRIIKVGLHASEFVQAQAIGGYYHPAFRELCESYGYRCRIGAELTRLGIADREITVRVHPGCVSKAVGQKKANIRYFQENFGVTLHVCGDAQILPMQVEIAAGEQKNWQT